MTFHTAALNERNSSPVGSWFPGIKEGYPHLYRYGMALGIAALVIALRLWADPYLGRSGFAVFLTGMLVCAWVGGLGPSLICQTLLLLAQAWWFAPPGRPEPMTLQGVVSMLAFYSVGGIVALLSEASQRSYSRLIEQKHEALSEREKLRATLGCIGDGVIVTDAEGQIALMNPVAERMTGWGLAECEYKPIGEIVIVCDENSSQTIASPVNRVLRHGEILHENMDWHLTTRDGTLIPVSFSVAPIFDDRHRTTGVVLIFSDQTERRQTLEQLRDANRRKDEFLATLAHELRNPLAPISTGVELLKLAADDREMMEEVVGTMERQTRHMVRLIDDLLDVSRITRGKVELRKSEVQLSQVIQDAVEATRPLVDDARHELQVILPDQPIVLYADPNRLTQVLSNVLNNAAKYTPLGGVIRLEAQRIQNKVAITIEDNGMGITPEDQEHIFEMFTQARHSAEQGHSGLGIGLTLVKRLVEMHGGTVEVQSGGSHQGTCFRILLPDIVVESTVKFPSPRGDQEAPSATTGRVLIVDDNEDALKTLCRLVELQGHVVCLARDGLEAITKAEEFQPDIVLMDIGMPGMNGYQAARLLRQQPWAQRMALVATTGWGQEEDRRRTREAGFDHHLVKPVEKAKLEEVMAHFLSSASTHNSHDDLLTESEHKNDSVYEGKTLGPD